MDARELAQLEALAHNLGWTANDLQSALRQLTSGDTPTLSAALRTIESGSGARVTRGYPQGRKYLLEGIAPDAGQPGHAGFGHRPITDLTVLNVRVLVESVHQIVGARQVRRSAFLAAGSPRMHGHGAAEQVVRAARRVTQALLEAGLLSTDSLHRLRTPVRPGHSRDLRLSAEELSDYVRIVLRHSQEPELDALIWVVLRVCALRNEEVIQLTSAGADRERGSLTISGKQAHIREMPLHRPVLGAILALGASRPGGPALFRTARGRSISGRRFDEWSNRLHAEAYWARGHKMGVQALRVTTARAIEDRFGMRSLPVTLYLGHRPANAIGVTNVYLDSPFRDTWIDRCRIAEATFGPLDAWPHLPEAGALRVFLPELSASAP